MDGKIVKEIIEYISKNNLGNVFSNYSFKMITTLRVGGDIAVMFYPNSEDSLIEVVEYLNSNCIKYIIIGNGSNILASDDYYDGVVISLKQIPNQFILEKINDEEFSVIVNSGCSAKRFSDFLLSHSITGAEAIGSIPASIGGIVAMNATCYDYSSVNCVKRVKVLIGNKVYWLDKSELEFSYRSSKILKEKIILLRIEFIFKKGIYLEIKEKIDLINDKRKKTQPLNLKSAGSTFKNSQYYSAWKVIDELGLRGYRIGDAMVSNQHTNFLVNVGNASSKDFVELINYIKKTAKNKLNIDLETEWILINF